MYNGVYTKDQYAYLHDTMVKWVGHKIRGRSVGGCLKERGVDRVAIYGINDFGRMVYEDVKREVSVEAFVDKRAQQISEIDGLTVHMPEDIGSISDECYILVTPEYYYREILDKLLECGAKMEHILSIAMVME